jgi:hypothetical protein
MGSVGENRCHLPRRQSKTAIVTRSTMDRFPVYLQMQLEEGHGEKAVGPRFRVLRKGGMDTHSRGKDRTVTNRRS